MTFDRKDDRISNISCITIDEVRLLNIVENHELNVRAFPIMAAALGSPNYRHLMLYPPKTKKPTN
jgi:hypothetical protein